MDGVGARLACRLEHRLHVQVALAGVRRPDADRLVGAAYVQCILIRGREDGDRLEVELAARADHPERDLSAVGDEDLLHRRRTGQSLSSAMMSWPASTSS